jgi:predicted transcriptional regulator
MSKPKSSPLPILTRAESEIMHLLWTHGPLTVNGLLDRTDRSAAYNTVLTLTRILEQKGYVAHSPHPDGGKAHLYRAAVEPGKARRQHVRDLLDRLFGGSAHELVTGLLDQESLAKEDLKALREKIDARLGEKRPRSR